MIQVICVKWGAKYDVVDVNRLHRAVKRHATVPIRFICVTERPDGPYDPDIQIEPFPAFAMPFESLLRSFHLKLSVFAPGILQDGSPAIFFDLDTAVLGDVKKIADPIAGTGDILLMQNALFPYWKYQKQLRPILKHKHYYANSSIMGFRPEDFHFVFEDLNRHLAATKGALPKFLRSDDRFISYCARDRLRVFPSDVAVKFLEEYMLPSYRLEEARKILPWVAARRKALIAVTFNGAQFKASRLVAMKRGDIIRHRNVEVRWDHEDYADYWRDDEPAAALLPTNGPGQAATS